MPSPKSLIVGDCNGCLTCQGNCPPQAITMVNKRPVGKSFPTGLVVVVPPFSSRRILDLGTRFGPEMTCTPCKLISTPVN